jgi:hypothetical protein
MVAAIPDEYVGVVDGGYAGRSPKAPAAGATMKYRWVSVCILSCLSCGCSLAFVSYPPSEPSERTVGAAADCTASHTWPIVDALGVGASAGNIALVSSSNEWTTSQKRVLVPVHIGYGVLAAASAIYGFVGVSRCEELRREVKYDPNAGPRWSPALKK